MKKLFFFLIAIGLSMIVLSAQATSVPDAVLHLAENYFVNNAKANQLKTRAQNNEIVVRYQSKHTAINQVFVLQQVNGDYLTLAYKQGEAQIIGYAHNQNTEQDILTENFMAFLNYWEQLNQLEKKQSVAQLLSATPVVSPMLNEANIHLNQYSHEEFGGCPSGCVATALAQIMAFYKHPQQGIGQHCYNTNRFGEHCVDFQNTQYNWNNPTDEDYKKLSKHVGAAIEMNYCGDDQGSAPGAPDYISKFCYHFNYHNVQHYTPPVEYIHWELNVGRPVYISLPGNPGHAVIADGYDSNGFIHLNFGWGGLNDGYYQLNTNTWFDRVNLNTNILDAVFLLNKPIPVHTNDSLNLLAVNQVIYNKWDTQKPVAQWLGVKLAGGRVVELDLTGGRHLEGAIPVEIGNLSKLYSLKIAGNLSGNFPESIYNLTELRRLQVVSYENQLHTPVSPKIGDMVHLKELEITRCWSGTLPEELGNLNQLKTIKLWQNSFSGNIPSSISNLKELYLLDVAENGFSGNIPASLSQLSNLTGINLSKNSFSGTIPENVGLLKKLFTLKLAENQLEGNIPSSFANLTNLTELDVSNNYLGGPFPAIFDSIFTIKTLAINNNQFTHIPENIGNLSQLRTLKLDHNLIEEIPETIRTLTQLTALDLSSNRLTDLPVSLARLGLLRELNVRNNVISQFPMALINLINLERLDLSYNKLTFVPEPLRLIHPAFLYLNNNNMEGPIPEEILKREYLHFKMEGNRFIYHDIPRTDSILNPVGDQQAIPIKINQAGVLLGDSMQINARKIISKTSPGDIYSWYAYDANDEKKRGKLLATDSILTLTENDDVYNKKFYCIITNEDMPMYLYSGYVPLNSLNALYTDTFTLKQWDEQEFLNDKYQTHVHQSENVQHTEISDRFVHLVSPWKVRGSQQWQASLDLQNWHNLSMDMAQTELQKNLESVTENELVLFPKTTAWYRNALIESRCIPRYSDTLKVVPYGDIICDTVVNVSTTDQTISLDSIEVIIPAGLVDGDVRVSIIESDKFTVMPDNVLDHGPIYEVHVDCGTNFDKPLIVKFKLKDIDPMKIENYRPAYFDELLQEWVFYDNSSVQFEDNTMTFITDHLTKLSRFNLVHPGYTHVHTNSKVNVIYNTNDSYINVIDIIYHPLAAKSPNPWYDPNIDPENNGAPYFVQDVAHYMKEIIEEFTAKGLKHPSLRFNVYLKKLGSAAGQTDAGTYLAGRGYVYIDPDFSTNMKNDIKGKREYLKSVLAHEYMHFTQDYYMTVMVSNYFWMEATAPLADRIVWPTETLQSIAEPEQLLSEALETKKEESSIFDVLSRAWYNSWNLPVVSKLVSGSKSGEMNLASLFLHYMRSYRPGTKLDPVELLKQTPYTKSWVGYLDDFIKKNLQDGDPNVNIGTEYDNYVRFLYGGSAKNFNVFHKVKDDDADHLKYLTDNYKSFINKYIRVTPEQKSITETIAFSMDNLSSKIVQIHNKNLRQKLLIQYYRKSKPQNIAIYTGKYNLKKKLIEWTDVSNKDTITFVAGYYDPVKPENNEYMSYILFVNKSSNDWMNTSISDEMVCTAIPDLLYFDGLLFARNNSLTPIAIHKIEESDRLQTLFGGDDGYLATSIYRVHASSYNSTMSFNQTITDSTIVVHVQSEIITQHFTYNFLKGTLDITHSMRLRSGYDFEEDFSGSFTNIWFVPVGSEWGSNRYAMKLKDTAETKANIKNMQYKYKSIRHYIDLNGQQQTEETSRTYIETQYPYSDIVLHLIFY